MKLNFVGLGGMTEIGMKMYVLEIENDLYIFDAGMKYPDDVMFGIDKIIPDMNYIRNNQKRVKGVFISNISDNNIGSLVTLMESIDAPIYASYFTIAVLKPLINNKEQKFVSLKTGKAVKLDNITVTGFNLTYSVPGNLGFNIESDGGNIVYVSDYVFNQNVPKQYMTDLAYLATLKNKNILALISPAKGAETLGYGANDPDFLKEITHYIRKMEGSLFLNVFTKNLLDIQMTIFAAEKAGKKICILGRRGYEIISTAFRNKEILMQSGTLTTLKNINSLDRDKVIYLVLGDEGVPYDLMLHLLSDTHREVRVHPEDMVLLAVTKVPGSELKISSVVDVAFQRNIKAAIMDYKHVMADTAGIEDMKLLQNFIEPKYLIANDAEFRQLVEFQKNFNKKFNDQDTVLFAESGEWISFENGVVVENDATNLTLDDILVNGELFEDSENYILKEREQLSADGVVILTVAILEDNGTYTSQYINYQSLGFIPEEEQKSLIKEIKTDVTKVIEKTNSGKGIKINELKRKIQETINQTIYREIKRYPIVVVQFIMQKK